MEAASVPAHADPGPGPPPVNTLRGQLKVYKSDKPNVYEIYDPHTRRSYWLTAHLPPGPREQWKKAPESVQAETLRWVAAQALTHMAATARIGQVNVEFNGPSEVKIRDRSQSLQKAHTVTLDAAAIHPLTGDLHKAGIKMPYRGQGDVGGVEVPQGLHPGYGPHAAVLALSHQLPEVTGPPNTPYGHLEALKNKSRGQGVASETEVAAVLSDVGYSSKKSRIHKNKTVQSSPLDVIGNFTSTAAADDLRFQSVEVDIRGKSDRLSTQDLVRNETIVCTVDDAQEEPNAVGIRVPRHKLGWQRYPKEMHIEQNIAIRTDQDQDTPNQYPVYNLTSAIAHQRRNGQDVYVTYTLEIDEEGEEDSDEWWETVGTCRQKVLWSDVEEDLKHNGTYFGYVRDSNAAARDMYPPSPATAPTAPAVFQLDKGFDSKSATPPPATPGTMRNGLPVHTPVVAPTGDTTEEKETSEEEVTST